MAEDYSGLIVMRTSTAEQIADGLTRMIMTGEMAPGTKVKETVIAARMGISRNTVREAVRLLEQGGLVRHEMYKGTVVVSPSASELNDLYAARMALEVAAVRVPIIGDDLERIEESFTALQSCAENELPGAARDLVANDLLFHASIVATLNSRRINDLYQQLAKEMCFYLMVLADNETPRDVVADHKQLLRLIQAGDPDAAVRGVIEHISRNATRVEGLLAQRQV